MSVFSKKINKDFIAILYFFNVINTRRIIGVIDIIYNRNHIVYSIFRRNIYNAEKK